MSSEEVVARTLSDVPSDTPQNFTLEAVSSMVSIVGISHVDLLEGSVKVGSE